MDETHREVLLKARVVLVDQLVADDALWSHLLDKDVFDRRMLERIICLGTPHERRQKLMDDLPRRGPSAFSKFVRILRETGQSHLADYLEAVDRCLRRGEEALPQAPQRQQRRPSVDRSTSRIGVISVPDVLPVQEILERNEDDINLSCETEGVIENRLLMPKASSFDLLEKKSANNWEGTYRIQSNPKGLLLIISNKKFKGKTERKGTEVDCENLNRVFTNIGYELYENTIFTDQSGDQMRDLCKRFILDPRHGALDSCILCILSHGDGDGVIYGSDDGKVTEDELFTHFNSSECSLHKKPKLVIIQACRGSMRDRGRLFDQTDSTGEDGRQTTAQKIIHSLQMENYNDTIDLKNRVPIYADIIFAHSTTPGFVSWRHEFRGSWFIQSIAKTFAEHAHDTHVLDMLTIVSRVVTQAFGANTDYGKGAVSMPTPVSRLLKSFYFFPK